MNWNKRYIKESSYRTRKYQSGGSPGPDIGGVPITHPFTKEFLDEFQRPREDYDGDSIADASGNQYQASIMRNIHEQLKTNPNPMIRMTRFLHTNPEGMKPEELDINPGDWCAIAPAGSSPGVTAHSDGRFTVVKDLPAKHIYFHPQYGGELSGFGYHPRRGLTRGLGSGFPRTTVEQSVSHWRSLPEKGLDYPIVKYPPELPFSM
jgi:hypothetical protein